MLSFDIDSENKLEWNFVKVLFTLTTDEIASISVPTNRVTNGHCYSVSLGVLITQGIYIKLVNI